MVPTACCVREDRDGVVSIISVAGELDIATAPTLQSALDRVHMCGANHILVDLSETDFLETTGLRTLLTASRRSAGKGSLSIVCPNPNVRRVFELTGVAELLVLHDDRTSAIRWHHRRAAASDPRA